MIIPSTTPVWASVPSRLRAVREVLASRAARRLFLDRKVDFWLGEIDPAWSLREGRARVARVIDEAPGVKTFELEPGAGWPGHRAGQWARVEVEIEGVRVARCYSISSAPGAERLTLTVKRVPGGRVSGYLHDEVRAGMVLGLGLPEGDFVLPEPTPARLLLLSGGSGVTPVMAILRDLVARGGVGDLAFVHAARSARDVIFARELADLAAQVPGLRVHVWCDDAAPGRQLDEAALRAMVPDFTEREAFLCGPAGMTAAMEEIWARAGASRRLRLERFAPLARAPVAGESRPVSLRLSRSGRTIVAGPGTLLDQLEAGGARPASGCRMGICQTCRCKKRSGTVEDLLTGAVSSEPDEEIRLCVSIARSDLDLAL
jgi:ferredoxin-NADP reductase